ncbi:MAG TPA: methyl-accepting chemotaxis protein [Noviherbaspirillum sp.]|nr:methyl-accepting chemotaxis protein [Noviherbaspirillum sp.]
MYEWWSRIGLKSKLQILIQGFLLIFLLISQQLISNQFEQRALTAAKERTTAVADSAINGLNTLMDITVDGKDVISDAPSKARFIRQIGISEGIKELRIVRGKGTNDEFGPGLPEQEPVDDMDRSVLANGKPEYKMTSSASGEASLRAVLPFIAMKEFRSSKCLDCHGVDEGTILGAASVTLDIKDDLAAIRKFNIVLWIGQLGLQLVLFFVIGAIVRRSLEQLGAEPSQAASVAQSVAQGDLGLRIELKQGDTHSLMAQLNAMQDSLSKVVSNVRMGAESVATASTEIAQGNRDLSARTEQQASALEETAASMEELGSQVKQNADSARQANQLAQDASAVALKGGGIVDEVVATMKSINDASQQIAEIIGVIDGIAFQTNILALNAAVEAARAGEQGRGFAVVATEVRSLAGRAAQAAKEVKTLIDTSVERVGQGTVLVDQAGTTMQEIVKSIGLVSSLMAEISAASHEQSIGVGQVGEAIAQMDEVTQHNAALVEEIAAAADNLKSQAQELVQTVSVFKLGANDESQTGESIAAAVIPHGAATAVTSLRPRPQQAAVTPRSAVARARQARQARRLG